MFKITKYEFENEKELTIALFSDIHYYSKLNLKKLSEIENRLNELKPDYVFVTGDIIDRIEVTVEPEFKYLLSFLERLADISKLILNFGNHDIRCHDKKKYNNWWEKLDSRIIILNNKEYEDEYIYVYGISLGEDYYKGERTNIKQLIQKIDEANIKDDKYNILLFHSPVNFTDEEIKKRNKFDLVLTGHTHNGLTPHFIPGNFGLVAPSHACFLKNARNSFKSGKSEVIISGGITKLSRGTHLRIFDRFFASDLVYIYLKKGGKN